MQTLRKTTFVSISQVEATPTSILPTHLVETSATLLLPMSSVMIEPRVSAVFEDMTSSINQLTLQPPLSLAESITTQILSFSKTVPTRATQVPSIASRDAFMNKEGSSTMLSLLVPTYSESMDTIISPSPTITATGETLLLPLPSSELFLLSETPLLLQTSELLFDESSLPFPSGLLQVTTTSMISNIPAILKQTVSPQPTDIGLTQSQAIVMSVLPEPSPIIPFPFVSTLFNTPRPSVTSYSGTTLQQTLQLDSSTSLVIKQTTPQPSIPTHVLEESSSLMKLEIQPTITTTIIRVPVTSSSIVEMTTQLFESVSYSLNSLFPDMTIEMPPKSTISQLFLEKFSLSTTPSTYLPFPTQSISSLPIPGIEPSFSPSLTTSLPLSQFSFLQVEATPTSILPTHLVETSATLLLPMSSVMIEPRVSAVFEDMTSSINQLTLQPPLSLAESIATQTLLSNQVTNLLQLSVSISTATARPMTESLPLISPSSELHPLSESPSLISPGLFEYEGSSTLFPGSLLSNIQPTTLLGLSKTPVPTFSSFPLPPQLFHTSPLEPTSTSPPAPSSSSLFEGLASSNNTLMSSSDQVSLSKLLTQNPPRTPVMPTTGVTSVQTEIPPLLNQTNTPFSTQLTATSSNSAVLIARTSIQMPTTQLPMLTTHPFLSIFISKSVVQLISAEVSTSSLSSVDPASVSAQLTITRIHTSFSQSSSRGDTHIPTSVGTIEPTNVLSSTVQVTPSFIRRTSVSAVISTDIPHMSSSQLMAVPSTTPLVASPTLVSKTEGPKPISQSPSFTLMTTPGCPQSLQVVYTANHLVDIVLALIVIEHMELVVDRSPRQCRLEQALVKVFDLGLQRLSERSQGTKKRQLQNSGNYTANVSARM